MKLIDQYRLIKSRADFYRVLAEARTRTEAMIARYPGGLFEIIGCELSDIARWTANGRTPTKRQRSSMTIQRLLAREFEGELPDEVYEWTKYVGEAEGYFHEWNDDPTFQKVGDTDLDPWLGHVPDDRVDPRSRAVIISQEAAVAVDEVERLMREAGVWEPAPLPPAALRFSAPFGADTMSLEQWIQFVLVPRVRSLVPSNGPWPDSSQVSVQALSTLRSSPARGALIAALCRLDRVFNGN